MDRRSGIYCFENKVNGKKYIGQAANLRIRMARHESNLKRDVWEDTSPRENKPLWLAVKKYGRCNFSAYVIEYCDVRYLDDLEIQYIKELSSHYSFNGYNLSWGGPTCKGVKHTEQSKKNMSVAHMGHKVSDEQKEKMRKNITGKKHSKSSSKYVGVYKIRVGDKDYWVGELRTGKKKLYVGCFKQEVLAAQKINKYILENNLPYPLNEV